MKNCLLAVIGILLIQQPAWSFQRFGERYCADSQHYSCLTIKRGDSWGSLFPDAVQRDIVKRVNRMNVFLQPDMTIAVPKNLANLQANDLSPFDQKITTTGEKEIIVNRALFAWAAYDEYGYLLKWGPISPGTEKCLDMPEGCRTPDGDFRVTRKDGEDCESRSYPHRMNGVNGGGEMPWCVYFHKGYALHGSSDLPGYEASYGCVRLFVEDAKWINQEFVDVPSGARKGTRVVIRAL